MKRLYVLYDARCELCRRCRSWLAAEPAFVPLTFVPFQSPEAGCRFFGLDQLHPEKELLVISDAGEVWRGGSAWVMCLWALREFREWSQRLASPALLPLAKRACELVSNHRAGISRRLLKWSDAELQETIARMPDTCANQGYCKAR